LLFACEKRHYSLMFRLKPALLVLLLLAARPLRAAGPEWELTFVDDFDHPALDKRKWNPRDPWEVVRNQELQAYVSNSFSIEKGVLQILCTRTPAVYDGARRRYSSGMMTTAGKFSQKYGKFEIRCKVPRGKGLWPAFWMLPDPPAWPPEIDILEILGHEPKRVHLTLHWPHPDNPKTQSLSNGSHFTGPDFSADFHTFGIEWEKGEIRWYVDGTERHRATQNVPDVAMFLMINLAVGGWAGEPDPQTIFPASFEIDYVKAWRAL